MEENSYQWCRCDHQGTCIGCLIQALILKHFGLEGEKHLAIFVPEIRLQEKEPEFNKALVLAGGFNQTRAISAGMTMGMGTGTK